MDLTAELVEQILQVDGFLKNFKLNRAEIEDGKVELEFDLTDNLLRVGRVMNGGAIATILDFTGGLAVMNSNDIVNQVTSDISIQFLRPVAKGPVTVRSWITKNGKNITYVEMEMTDANSNACAKGIGSWFVYRNE